METNHKMLVLTLLFGYFCGVFGFGLGSAFGLMNTSYDDEGQEDSTTQLMRIGFFKSCVETETQKNPLINQSELTSKCDEYVQSLIDRGEEVASGLKQLGAGSQGW